jgi:hypothetical protein
MPNDLTNFQKDLNNPDSGLKSEIHRAIRPFTEGVELNSFQDPYNIEKIKKLKQDVRRGVVGLEYLTGLKNNDVETFYDAHPVQALVTDAAGNAGKLGLAAALGIPAVNVYRQYKNFKETEPAYHARRSDPEQRADSKLYRKPSKNGLQPLDEDIVRVFGDMEDVNVPENITRRLDMLSYVDSKFDKSKFIEKVEALETARAGGDERAIAAATRDLGQALEMTRSSTASKNLRDYVDLHRDISDLRSKGVSLKGDVLGGAGDKLRGTLSGKITDIRSSSPTAGNLIESMLPSSNQGLEDLIRKRIVDKNPNALNHIALEKVIGDAMDIDTTSASPEALKLKETLSTFKHKPNTGLYKLVRRFGPSAALGLGITGAGMGLHKLLNMLQSGMYGDDKIKEWKRNNLKARGEFEKAEAIK